MKGRTGRATGGRDLAAEDKRDKPERRDNARKIEDEAEERKAGGRVADHLTAADQLVRAAERAKKGQSAQTEALLQQPDSAVAHALEVANRSI